MSYLRQIGCFSNTFSTMDINCIICRSITYFSNIWPTFDAPQEWVLVQSKNSFFPHSALIFSKGQKFLNRTELWGWIWMQMHQLPTTNSIINIASQKKRLFFSSKAGLKTIYSIQTFSSGFSICRAERAVWKGVQRKRGHYICIRQTSAKRLK